MSESWVKWRRLPGTRRLHLLTWDATGDRRKYTSACGRVFLTSEVIDDPASRRCGRCHRRVIELAAEAEQPKEVGRGN